MLHVADIPAALMHTSKPLVFLFALGAFLLPLQPLRAESLWQIIKINNRDYLTLKNVADFYSLRSGAGPGERHIVLTDGRTRLETTGDGREIIINGVKQWLSFPLLSQGGNILVSRFDLAKTIEPCLRPTMIGNLQPFHTVIIDAGHGGADRGARSATGFEKDYTLAVVRELKRALENKGLRVLMTRADDTFLSLEGRAQQVNDTRDAIFVSVHFNSSTDGGFANGFEVFAMTPRGAASTGDNGTTLEQFQNQPGNDFDNASLALATSVHHAILGHIPQLDRGVKRARFAVLRLARAPAILVEGGFLTNSNESQRINDASWRKKLAESIAQGVQSYQELSIRKLPPKLLADYRSEQLPLLGTMIDPATIAARAPIPQLSEIIPASNPMPEASPAPAPANSGAAMTP
jgi:N-acetylmuramoyl-L-alanine amidase